MTRLTRAVPGVGAGPQPKGNRPDHKPRQPGNILFHDAGPTGWGRIRRLGDYKGEKSEANFDHLNDKFVGPGEA